MIFPYFCCPSVGEIWESLTIKYDFEYPEEKLLDLAKKVKVIVDDMDACEFRRMAAFLIRRFRDLSARMADAVCRF